MVVLVSLRQLLYSIVLLPMQHVVRLRITSRNFGMVEFPEYLHGIVRYIKFTSSGFDGTYSTESESVKTHHVLASSQSRPFRPVDPYRHRRHLWTDFVAAPPLLSHFTIDRRIPRQNK